MTGRGRPRGHARRIGRLLAAGALALVALGCPERDAASPRATDASAEPVRVVDAAGVEIVLPGPAARIVSLVPSATQTLRALGATDVLVGRTDFDGQAWARELPSVGGGLEPSLEAIVALQPDLVIRFGGSQDPRTPARLDDLGIPHLSVRPDHVDDIYATARMLGVVTGREAEADSLIAEMRSGLDRLRARASELPRRRVVYVLGGTPPWVSGPGTYIDEILALVGGVNVFSDLDALYSSVSPEQIRTREIDVALLSGEGFFDPTLVPGARLVVVGDALEIPGPDVVDAAHRIAELLHGRSLR